MSSRAFEFAFILSEIIIIILYLTVTDYSEGVDAADTITASQQAAAAADVLRLYPVF